MNKLFLIFFCTVASTLFTLSASGQVKMVTLNQLEQRLSAGKDTTFVVNFWATWCSPCIAELPYFDQLQQQTKDKKLKVILVSLDFKSKLNTDVIPFVKNRKLHSEVLLLNESNQQAYIDRVSASWSGAIPATLIVNTGQKKREFYEKEFTYKDLVSTLEQFKLK